MSINEMTIKEFCSIQGVAGVYDKPILLRMYNGQVKSYEDWYILVSKDFEISERKFFEYEKKKK